MEIEVWKPIEGYENYEVSNMGRVRSLNYKKTGKLKVLKLQNNNTGYLQVTLCKNSKTKIKLIHRFVAEAFIPNPENLPCINHKNEIKTDNRVENLEWCSYKYNLEYSNNQKKATEAAVIVNSKPVLQYTKTGELVAEYPSVKDASRQTGINKGNISQCCRGDKKYKSAGNFIWKFKE